MLEAGAVDDDQDAVNAVWTPGQEGSRNWRRGDALDLPAGVLVHHANWTKGLANKVSQLEAVDELVAERAGPG